MTSKKSIYLKLFTTTFTLSAFTFGGGYVIIGLMKKKFADELGWLSEEEVLNLTALAQSAPGVIAVNASLLVGYRVAGFLGGIVCVIATVLPPLITISIISVFYSAFRDNVVVGAVMKGMQAGVAAVIADVVTNMGGKIIKSKDWYSVLIMAAAFIATWLLGVNVVIIILCCGVLGALRTLYTMKKGGAAQ